MKRGDLGAGAEKAFHASRRSKTAKELSSDAPLIRDYGRCHFRETNEEIPLKLGLGNQTVNHPSD
jgi:hypothetical protein